MTEQELQQERRSRWRVNDPERGIRTLEDARGFLNSVGFCLTYPSRPAVVAPTFIGAYAGMDAGLPERKKAFGDDRALHATELTNRMLKERSAFELPFGDADTSLLVSAAEFPFFYALMGDRNPKNPPSAGARGERRLFTEAFTTIQENGPISENELLERLGKAVSQVVVAHTLQDLWAELRIVRTDARGEQDAPMWNVMYKWAPEELSRAMQISRPEAMSALASKYLEQVVAAEQSDIEIFFGHLAPRSKVTDVVRAMLAAREFDFVVVDGKTLLRVSTRGEQERVITPPQERKPRAPKIPVKAKHFSERALFQKKGAAAANAEDQPRKSFGDRPPRRDGDRPPRRGSGDRPPRREYGERAASGDRPRKSFGERKSFGDRPPRREFGDRPPRREFGDRPPRKAFGDRKPFGDRAASGERPRKSFGERKSFGDRPARREFGDRPPRKEFGDRPPRKEFGDRKPFGDRAASGERPRKSFGERKSFGDRPPRREGGERPPRKEFGDRPARKQFGDRKPFGDRSAAGDRPRKSFGERKSFGDRPPRKEGDRPPRKDGERAPRREFGDRPASGDRPRKSFGDRPRKNFGERKSFGDRPPRKEGDRPPRREFGDRPPRKEFGDRAASGERPRKSFGGKPGGKSFGGGKGFGARKSSGRPPFKGGKRPGGSAGGGGPRGNRPGGRKPE